MSTQHTDWEKYWKMANGSVKEYIGFAFGKCMDMGSEQGGLMSVEALPQFTEAMEYLLSHAVAYGEAKERKRIQVATFQPMFPRLPIDYEKLYEKLVKDLKKALTPPATGDTSLKAEVEEGK